MALFFNANILQQHSGSDPHKFMAMLEYHYSKMLPNTYSKYKPCPVSLAGYSYLLNPRPLFTDKTTDVLFKVQYIKLAALRDWNLYKLHKYKALQTSYYPDIKYDAIQSNPLLNITKSEIQFKYEES